MKFPSYIQFKKITSIVCDSNPIILLLIGFLVLNTYANEGALETEKAINIGIVNFIYINDNGYDPEEDAGTGIETTILFKAIETECERYQIPSYSINFERVLSGEMRDYDMPRAVSTNLNGNGDPYDIIVWGLVKPISWPRSYDLQLFLFRHSVPVNLSKLKIRNNRIVNWNGKSANLPEEAIRVLPGVLIYKLAENNKQTDIQTNQSIMVHLGEYGAGIPLSEIQPLIDWTPDRFQTESVHVSEITLDFESNTSYKLKVDRALHDILQRFLTTDRSFNWYLEQSGLLMPEITISIGEEDNEVEPASFEMNYATEALRERYKVGILPIANNSESDQYDWIGFGLEYLLSNKLSYIPSYKLADKAVVLKFSQTDSSSVLVNGEEWSLDYSIAGEYTTDGNALDFRLDYLKSWGDVTVSSDRYRSDFKDIFDIIDEAVAKFVRVTGIDLTKNEKELIQRRVTNSIKAFKYFCLGYIENSRQPDSPLSVINYFNKAITEDPEFWGAYYNLGTTYYNQQDYDKALQQFMTIIDHFPKFEMAYLGRGLTYLQKKEYQHAKDDFMTYASYRPADFRAHYYLGRVSSDLKQYGEAVNHLIHALKLNPNYANIYFELGNVYYAKNRFRTAIARYRESLNLDPYNIEARKFLGESYYRMHNFTGAIDEFNKVLLEQPDDPESNFMLGITVYKQALLDEYIDAFLEMYGLKEKSENPKDMAKSEADKLKIQQEMIQRFYTAQRNRENFFEATFNLALTYQELSEPDSAEFYYWKTIRINPNLVKAHIVLAKFYEKQGKLDQALEQYKQVVKIDPDYFIAYSILGPPFDNINIINVVINELEDKIKADPKDIESSLELGRIYHAQGFNGKAVILYRQVINVYPHHREATKMLAQIENGS